MPVIPSFSAFAQTPNMAQAYLGAARISSDLAQHARSIQLQHAKLAQDAQQAEIEIAARSAAADRHELREEQEREIEKSYNLAQLGLKERALKGEEEVLQFKVQEAAKMASAQMKYQSLFRQYGGDSEAAKRAMLEVGPEAGFPGGAYTAALRPPPRQATIPFETPQEYKSPTNGRAFYRGSENAPWRIQSQEYDVEGRMERGEQRKAIQNKITRLEKENEESNASSLFGQDMADLSQGEKEDVFAYKNRAIDIQKLQRELEKLRVNKVVAPTATRTNRVGRFNIISN